MEFKIEKNEFLRGLYLAPGIADRKSTLPILANVLLRTEGKDRLLCGATDLTVTHAGQLSAKVEKEGGLTVAARQLYEIVKGLPDDEVRVRRTEQNWAEIRSGKVEFKVVGMADRDYPKLPSVQEAETFKVESATLREMIAKTIFSVSPDETRQHLSGVLFESDGTTARMVSTDGHRLSKVGRATAGRAQAGEGVLIPRKGVLELRRAIETREAPCAIGVYQGNFVLKADDVSLSVKLIDGQFPPYDQVIPKDNDRAVVVSRRGAPRRPQARGASCRRTRPGACASASRRASCASRATTPTSAPPRRRSTCPTRGRRCRSGSTRATSSTCSPRSRRPRFGSSCRASSIPAWCGRPTAATTSASSCR